MVRPLAPPSATTAVPSHFVPLQHGPWLSRKVWTPGRRWTCAGLLTLSILLPLGIPVRTVSFVLGFLRYGGTFFVLCLLLGVGIGLFGEAMVVRTRQYCPACLRYMTRGAHVCPFCHFHPSSPHA